MYRLPSTWTLLKRLPNKRSVDAPKERAADLASLLRKNEDSPFFQRVVTTTAPKEGQVFSSKFCSQGRPTRYPGPRPAGSVSREGSGWHTRELLSWPGSGVSG